MVLTSEELLQDAFGFIAAKKTESVIETPADVESWFLVRTEFLELDGRWIITISGAASHHPHSSMNSSNRHIANGATRANIALLDQRLLLIGV